MALELHSIQRPSRAVTDYQNPCERKVVPNATVMVTETTGDASASTAAKKGVYVLTSEYLAVCIHESADKPDAGTTGKCTVILKRGEK